MCTFHETEVSIVCFEEMQGLTVFEIPIYARAPEEHKRKWMEKRKRDFRNLIKCGLSENMAKELSDKNFRDNSFWRYNQLVGMICLSVKPHDPLCNEVLLCNLYCNTTRPRYVTSRCFLPFENRFLFYEKIYISKILDDEDLVVAIKEKINFLKEQHNLQNCYFDCAALKNTISLGKIKALFTEKESRR